MTHEEAVKGLQQMLATGDEGQALTYIRANFASFSDDFKKKFLIAIMSETMQQNLAEREKVAAFKAGVLEILEEMDAEAGDSATA